MTIYSARIQPRENASAYYAEKDAAYLDLSHCIWKSEDDKPLEPDYCFDMLFYQDLEQNGQFPLLSENPQFAQTLAKIEKGMNHNWVPARLLIGKKALEMLDGTRVELICHSFGALKKQLDGPRESDKNEPALMKRLEEISVQIDKCYGEQLETPRNLFTIDNRYAHNKARKSSRRDLQKRLKIFRESNDLKVCTTKEEKIGSPDSSEASCMQKFFSCLLKILLFIPEIFLRLFTCNWTEKTCLTV